jgi:hypothetical protein
MTDLCGTSFPTAAPPNAVLVWASPTSLFVELPTKAGPPYVLSFPRNSIGLSKLLAAIYGNADVSGPSTPYIPTRKLIGTPTQHASALAALRRAGIIK